MPIEEDNNSEAKKDIFNKNIDVPAHGRPHEHKETKNDNNDADVIAGAAWVSYRPAVGIHTTEFGLTFGMLRYGLPPCGFDRPDLALQPFEPFFR